MLLLCLCVSGVLAFKAGVCSAWLKGNIRVLCLNLVICVGFMESKPIPKKSTLIIHDFRIFMQEFSHVFLLLSDQRQNTVLHIGNESFSGRSYVCHTPRLWSSAEVSFLIRQAGKPTRARVCRWMGRLNGRPMTHTGWTPFLGGEIYGSTRHYTAVIVGQPSSQVRCPWTQPCVVSHQLDSVPSIRGGELRSHI